MVRKSVVTNEACSHLPAAVMMLAARRLRTCAIAVVARRGGVVRAVLLLALPLRVAAALRALLIRAVHHRLPPLGCCGMRASGVEQYKRADDAAQHMWQEAVPAAPN